MINTEHFAPLLTVNQFGSERILEELPSASLFATLNNWLVRPVPTVTEAVRKFKERYFDKNYVIGEEQWQTSSHGSREHRHKEAGRDALGDVWCNATTPSRPELPNFCQRRVLFKSILFANAPCNVRIAGVEMNLWRDGSGGRMMPITQQQLFFKEASDATHRAESNLAPDEKVQCCVTYTNLSPPCGSIEGTLCPED